MGPSGLIPMSDVHGVLELATVGWPVRSCHAPTWPAPAISRTRTGRTYQMLGINEVRVVTHCETKDCLTRIVAQYLFEAVGDAIALGMRRGR